MSLGEEYWRYFCGGYTAARSRFLHVAEIAGARLTAYRHPKANGPQGEPLYVDVAEIGPADAPRILLAVSGTHGLEAAAGSAVQVAWLSAYASKQASLPPDTAVVLVHSINPYGFAWGTRTTENNVDLNRNFVDHDDPSSYPVNPDYARLHQDLVVEHWDEEHLSRVEAASQAFREAHGDDAFFNARAMGQYQFADGLAYGGRAREWSNQTLQTIVESHLRAAQQVAFIDWHTGLGDYAQPFFLCFNAEGSALQREAVRWWSEAASLASGLTASNVQIIKGCCFRALRGFLQAVRWWAQWSNSVHVRAELVMRFGLISGCASRRRRNSLRLPALGLMPSAMPNCEQTFTMLSCPFQPCGGALWLTRAYASPRRRFPDLQAGTRKEVGKGEASMYKSQEASEALSLIVIVCSLISWHLRYTILRSIQPD